MSQPVSDLIKRRFPATIELTMYTVFPIILIGVFLGIAAAVNHNKFIDQAARVFAILGHSLPSFVFALLALMVFYANLGWFPPGRPVGLGQGGHLPAFLEPVHSPV